MAFLEDLTLGRYREAESPIHRLDPRLKLIGVPLLIIGVFSASGPGELLLLGLSIAALAGLSGLGWSPWWRGLRIFRWFFLFTVLVHVLFSPGRTMAGIPWLSLDGLERGLFVCGQLASAILLSSLLTLTTAPKALAQAFSRLAFPLRRFGVPVRETADLLMLVLDFIPVLREEAARGLDDLQGQGLSIRRGSLLSRAAHMRLLVAPLILRLIDRADVLAQEAAREEAPEPEEGAAPLGRHDRIAVLIGLPVVLAFLVL